MELKDFIKNTLLDIVDGVREAQEENETASEIVPAQSTSGALGSSSKVSFDVAIISESEDLKGRGIGVAGMIVKGGAGKEHAEFASTVSRVQFEVSVQLQSGFQAHQKR